MKDRTVFLVSIDNNLYLQKGAEEIIIEKHTSM
jgi:hypothetical protein